MKPLLYLFSVALTLSLTGCVRIWQDNLDIRTYMITTDRAGDPQPEPLADKLWIDAVSVLPPYNVRNLILRKNDVEFETSYYTELLMSPSENFRNEFFKWFHDSGLFDDVSITSRSDRSHMLNISILEMYADTEKREAVLSVKVTLFDERVKGLRVLMSNEYRERVEVPETGAEELLRAYNRALADILATTEQDVLKMLKAN